MIIAGIDVETTGVEPDKHEIVEIGIWVCNTNTPHIAICSYNSLFKVNTWSDEAAEIHKLTEEMVQFGILYDSINPYRCFIESYNVDYVIAHRAEFDKSFVVKCWPEFDNCKWLCSGKDLSHGSVLSQKPRSYRLMHLAVDYAFAVDGWHRALTDAKMVCMIASLHDLDKAWENKNIKKWMIIVWGPYDDEHRECLKSNDFIWFKENKYWIRQNIVFDDLESIVLKAAAPIDWEFEIKPMPQREY